MINSSLTTLMVSNLDKAVRFYTKVLGFQLKVRDGEQWAEIAAPGLTIALHPVGLDGSAREPSNLSIGFAVDNLDAARRTLEAKGVDFSGTRVNGAMRLAFFNDPDGTPLYLSQEVPT